MAINDQGAAAQLTAQELADSFRDPDIAVLERLTEAEREEQERARAKLFRYVDQMWDEVKARPAGPGDPAYRLVAGMRDIAIGLYEDVRAARHRSGDLDG
jgi:hypothetical protein